MQNDSVKEQSESVSQLYKELEELRKQSQASSTQLEVTMVSLEVERKKCSSLEDKLKETEGKWEGVVSRYKENEKDLKSKLNQLTRELETSKDDVASSHREVMKMKAQQDRVLDNSKSEAERLRIQLMKEQEQTRDLKRQLEKSKVLETSIEEVKKDRDVLAKELQTMIVKEQKSHAATSSAEVLETENKTLKEQVSDRDQFVFIFCSAPYLLIYPQLQGLGKLNESFKKQSDLIQDLSQVQSKNRELSVNLNNAKDNLQSAEETVKFLREELNRKSKELIDTFDFSREGQSKMESEVVNLHRNMEEDRTSFNRENNDLKLRLDVEERKNEQLQRALKEKTEEIANLRREVSRLSLNSTRLEERMQEEEKQRRSVESRNKVLEEELAKLWSQLKEVLDKHAANELSKTELQGELFRLTNLIKENDNHRAERQAENSAAITALSRAQQRAQTAERKIPELQEELDNTLLKLETAQTHADNLAASRKEIHILKEDLITLKLQLQEEKVNSSMLAKQLDDVQGHLKSTEERERHLEQMNSDLKHQLLTTQSELTDIKDKHRNVEDLHIVSEQGKQTLQERASGLQSELTRLQMELSQTANQLDNQSRKYMNLKLQTKEKLENAREIFNRHKSVLVENIQQIQNELNSVKGELEKQQNDKEETKKKHQNLLAENRQLVERLAENDETISDQGRNISSLEYRTKFLEQENGMLQDRISSLTRQRMALEKVVREYRMEKQKEDIYKSIGNGSSGLSLLTSHGPGLAVPKAPYSSGLGNSITNSLVSGTDAGRSVGGLLMKSTIGTPSSAKIHGYPIGLGMDSPRVADSDGMSADTEGR
ncbi:Laminin subunit alpha-1 [Holothuria leucospilota]|uniref:Laminin subunit alpha-1 n=1 Tax=Holothuria leucospilota TaxID=206669 RepID=A0A9Q0YHX0_HOLLE|nr:Laminin subunit alpha-1 [Holothuria leucospilota]